MTHSTKLSADIPTIAKISIALLTYILLYFFYIGVTTLPSEGDSLAYHIPIAKSILSGSFLHPQHVLDFYPGASESILSFFILFHLPLNLFNVLGAFLLFLTGRKLGRVYGLDSDLATIFAVSLCLLHLTTRWLPTQIIDIWLAVFFTYALLLLVKPERSVLYFINLGIALGFLIGSKSSAPFFAFSLLLLYGKNLLKFTTLKNSIGFIIPVSIFGLSWYIRNMVLTGNPLYPQGILFFKGSPEWDLLSLQVWRVMLDKPLQMFNAAFGEYTLWLIALTAPLLYFIKKRKNLLQEKTFLLVILGMINGLYFLFLPTLYRYNNMVSSFRYSYPAFIPLILSTFLLFQSWKKKELLAFFALINMLVLPTVPYHPKFLFFYIPLLILLSAFSSSFSRIQRKIR